MCTSDTLVDDPPCFENAPTIRDEVSRDIMLSSNDSDTTEIDELLNAAFRFAVASAEAEVGLLHRRTDAYLYTIAVHELDPSYHLQIGLSFWDPAVRWVLCNKAIEGSAEEGEEEFVISRRLSATTPVCFVLAVPVRVGDTIEAVIELGRSGSPFPEGMGQRLRDSLEALAT
jgi:hypothetical protein